MSLGPATATDGGTDALIRRTVESFAEALQADVAALLTAPGDGADTAHELEIEAMVVRRDGGAHGDSFHLVNGDAGRRTLRWTDHSIIGRALHASGVVVEPAPRDGGNGRTPQSVVVAAPVRSEDTSFGVLYGVMSSADVRHVEPGRAARRHARFLTRVLLARAA